jgi:ABC-2 type transport system permease protein
LVDFYIVSGFYIVSILTLGLWISTIATTQFQAMQLTFMFFLPQMLLSGFMFPFDGMPKYVQWFAEILPLTHFLRIVRGIILKQANLPMMVDDIWPLALFFVVMITLATRRFQKSLD